MLTFAAAVFFLIITPGPGVLSTAGVGAAYGGRAGTRYVLGLFIGTNLVAAAVVSGLAAVILANVALRNVLFALSTAYLFYLALRIAFAGSRIAFITAKKAPNVLNGIALQLINPKAYAVNTSLFSGFSFMPGDLLTETITKFIIVNAIWIPIHFLWLWMGIKMGQLNISERGHRIINFAMGFAMFMVVILAVASFIFAPPGKD